MMLFYGLLDKEEVDHIKDLKDTYDEKRYTVEVEKYLKEIKYPERLAEHYKDKWYIKVMKRISERKKSK